MLTQLESDWFKPWISASHRYGPSIAGHFATEIQDLGRMEIELRRREATMRECMRTGNQAAMLTVESANLYPLSAAWVMMAYEVLRTLAQRLQTASPEFAEDARHPIKHAKKVFTRLRIPLAKHESAKAFKDTWPHAELGYQHPMSVGWFLGPDEFITRSHLADTFIAALVSGFPSQQNNTAPLE